MPQDPNCLFCKIVKSGSANLIREDDHTLAFLDIMPRSPGHTLVIPKYHAETLIDLPDEEVAALFTAVKAVDILLMEKLTPHGMTIGVNQGKASGQEVDHVHVHLMPRWRDDKGHSIQAAVDNRPQEGLQEILRKITGR